ncbi:MAG: hybrid sensor histidine kinase/response regulator [Arcobacteraceae bacterium]|nr:hybrid sensor histidine kinase/response regulator [Arcobacteraceae bacterium]
MQINILIVDDLKANLISLEALLESIDESYNIIQANSGNEALEQTLNKNIDLIILDIQMPDMDGFEVAQLLKSNKKTANIPIIFLTAAFKSEEWLQKGFELGAIDYLTKPIDENRFINRISLYTKLISTIYENREKDKILNEQSKMVAMGEMIGNIAHQWRQPLSVISTGATGILMQQEFDILDTEKLTKTCNMINDNAQYLSKTIDDFKNYIKGDRVKTKFYIKKDINDFLRLVEGAIKSNQIELILDLENELEINGYENELIQCFINIFNNAKDILKEIGQDDRLLFITTKKLENKVVIKFKDSGGGVPEDIINKIFDPYFTTKHKSQGTGLGLHMTYDLIVNGMDGDIIVNNKTYKYNKKEYTGAEFTITLNID